MLFPCTGILKVSCNARMVQVRNLIIHAVARNIGTCMYMAWTGLGCLIQCINSIVWNKNMINRAPVYCDIGKRLISCFPNVHRRTRQRHAYKSGSTPQSQLPPFVSTVASTRFPLSRRVWSHAQRNAVKSLLTFSLVSASQFSRLQLVSALSDPSSQSFVSRDAM